MKVGDYDNEGWEVIEVKEYYTARIRVKLLVDYLKDNSTDIEFYKGELGYLYGNTNDYIGWVELDKDNSEPKRKFIFMSERFELIKDIKKIRKNKLKKLNKVLNKKLLFN